MERIRNERGSTFIHPAEKIKSGRSNSIISKADRKNIL